MNAHRLQEYIDTYDVDLDASVVALYGEEPLGICMLGLREGRAWLTRLGVLPTSRRHGAGRAMTEYCVEQAARRGLPVIYLEVIVGNTPAYELFARLGFTEVRHLLVLRRPPGPPVSTPQQPPTDLIALDKAQVVDLAARRSWHEAWTNQTESIINARNVKGFYVTDHASGLSGWISYERTALQLRRVMVGSEAGPANVPAASLLYHLHSTFPTLDTVAENLPADAPYLDAFYAHSYVESFRRIEMELVL